FIKRSLSFGSGDFNPHWFHKPAFLMYLLFFEYGILFIFGLLFQVWSSISDYAVSFIINPGPFILVGRLTVTFFSLLCIGVIYITGIRNFTKTTAIFGAILFTLSFGQVIISQDVKADIPSTFFSLLSCFFLLEFLTNRHRKHLILAAIFAGVGTATKTYPYVMVPVITLTLLWVNWWSSIPIKQKMIRFSTQFSLTLFFFYFSFFLCSPFNFLDPLGRQSTFGSIIRLLRKVHILKRIPSPDDFIGEQMSRPMAILDYFQQILKPGGMGVLIGCICILGIFFLPWRKSPKIISFFLFPFFLFILSVTINPGYAEVRHQMPIYPFLCLSGGYLTAILWNKSNSVPKIRIIGASMLCIFLLIPILKRGLYISREDTRSLSKTWIESNIPVESKILLDEDGPVLFNSVSQLENILELAKTANPKGQFTTHYDAYTNYQLEAAKMVKTYDIFEIRYPWWRSPETTGKQKYYTEEYDRDMANPLKITGVLNYEEYVNDGYSFAVLNEYRYAKPQFLQYTKFNKLYKDIFKHGKLLKEFTSGGRNPGPTIKIFKILPTCL
ncbi:MAG: glycosyltransferase family 39 protein, partial [Chitinispirillia bacterium]